MKKRILKLCSFLALMLGTQQLSAQQDVTSLYIKNAGFETTPLTFTKAGGDTPGTDRIGTSGRIYTIPEWTNSSVCNNNAVQIATAEYGLSSTVANGLNSTKPPTTDHNGNGGAALHMSAGWGDDAILTQKIAQLPNGIYRLSYHVYNAHSNANIAENFTGVEQTDGTKTYSTLKSVAQNQWVEATVEFVVKTTQDVTLKLGFTTSTGGSGNGAKLYVDNLQLMELSDWASEENPVNVTSSCIKNAGFESGAPTNTNTFNNPVDWTMTHETSGWRDGSINTSNPSEGSKLYNAWAGTTTSLDLHQNIANLPTGKYRLTADVRTEKVSQITNQGVYAQPDGGVLAKSETLSGVGNPWNGKDAWQTLSVEFEVVTGNSNTRIGISSTGGDGSAGWFQVDNFNLYYIGKSSVESLIPTFNERYAQLSALDLTKVLDAYKSQVQNTLNTYQTTPSTAGAMDAAINEMSALINDYNNQVNVATYNRMKDDYEYSYASLLDPDISDAGWTNSDFAVFVNNEHWNGLTSQSYYEQTPEEWGKDNWKHHADEIVTLPEGKYIMTITARASALVTSSMSVTVGDAEPQVVMLPNKGSVGYGITTDGTASFAEGAGYARNGEGFGWEYRFIEFTVAEGGQPVTVAFDASANAVHQWVSLASPMLYGSVHPKQVDILHINNLAANLRSYESKPMDKALYERFEKDLAAADAATVDSENLEDIVSALQADIATAKASVDAYAAYKATYDFYVEKVGQIKEAGQTYWNNNTGAAYAEYTNGTMTDAVAEEAKLKGFFNAALLAQGPGADLTLMITNPNYDNGSEGWPVNHSSTDGHSITYNGMFSYSVTGRFHHTDVYQENISLPAGTYCVSAKVNAPNPLHETSVFVYATTGTVNHWGDLFPGYVKCAYYDINQKETDQVLEAYFTLSKEALVRIGALTWGANVNGDGRGNFTVDDWTLRSVSSLVEGTTHKNFYGNFTQATVQAEVSAEVQVLDLTTASGLSNITLNVTNPNMLIYANAGQVASSQNNVIVNDTCASLSVADGAPFYVPTAFTATTATYTMSAVATEGSTSMGTLCLPFKVTSMPGKAYELVEEVAMGDVIYATPVTEIEANQPVLVSAKGAYTGSGEVAATQGGTYTHGYLVGTYNEFAAPQGSYVLQKHDNNVAFYLVGDVQPTVKPFRAYIKGTETSNLVKSIAIDFGFDATGIEGIEAAEGAVEVARYNAAGVQIAAPQKGVNFVRMSDGSVLKVMVK